MTIPDLSSRALAARTALLALCDALVSAADASHAGLAVPPPAPTPAPEVCCASPLCPHSSPGGGTSQVGGAAERDAGIVTPASSTPAPEAKRPTHVRVLGMALGEPRVREVLRWTPNGHPVVKHDCIYGFTSLQPGEWEPAPCPPPVAGRGEDDVRSAAQALIDEVERMFAAPYAEGVLFHREFKALKAALSRPVRP